MADQSYEEVVLELSFNIENPEAIPASASFDDTFGLSRDMLNRALVEYLDAWRGQTRLLPKQGAGRTSSYVFRKPSTLDEIKLVETTYFVTDLFLKNLAELAKAGELGHLRELVDWQSVARIVHNLYRHVNHEVLEIVRACCNDALGTTKAAFRPDVERKDIAMNGLIGQKMNRAYNLLTG